MGHTLALSEHAWALPVPALSCHLYLLAANAATPATAGQSEMGARHQASGTLFTTERLLALAAKPHLERTQFEEATLCHYLGLVCAAWWGGCLEAECPLVFRLDLG